MDLDFTEAGAEAGMANIADNDPEPVVEMVLDPAQIGENGGSARVAARMAEGTATSPPPRSRFQRARARP